MKRWLIGIPICVAGLAVLSPHVPFWREVIGVSLITIGGMELKALRVRND